MGDPLYNWMFKEGNIVVQRNGDCISLEVNYEGHDRCLLAPLDADEVIEMLTNIAEQIWHDPNYVKKPYDGKLFKTEGNVYYWDIDGSQLLLSQSETVKHGLEVRYKGSNKLEIEVNYAVEIIQILDRLNL